MPKGYLIGRVSVHDPESYKAYAAKASAAIAQYGGKILARGGKAEIVEGEGRTRNVILEFESFEQAKAYFFSPEYMEARRLRWPVSVGDFVIVEGV
ncbi:MAG: DUF1330 domain-containing protein [Methylobacterium sp.]|jgi:uncharacterized protein (DUF1330 family)|nr:DUF1330 domain-containing protein [Methylobacterium sp.]